MPPHTDRSELTYSYLVVALATLGNLAFAYWCLWSEATAGPAHDDDLLAGIGYVLAAVWGVPALIAAALLTTGRVATEQHTPRLALAAAALALNLAPWALLMLFR